MALCLGLAMYGGSVWRIGADGASDNGRVPLGPPPLLSISKIPNFSNFPQMWNVQALTEGVCLGPPCYMHKIPNCTFPTCHNIQTRIWESVTHLVMLSTPTVPPSKFFDVSRLWKFWRKRSWIRILLTKMTVLNLIMLVMMMMMTTTKMTINTRRRRSSLTTLTVRLGLLRGSMHNQLLQRLRGLHTQQKICWCVSYW